MVTRTGDREIGVVSGRLPDNTGELACMHVLKVNNNIWEYVTGVCINQCVFKAG